MGVPQLVTDTAARLRVCRDAGITAPPELLDDALQCLESIVDGATRRRWRDEMIRKAALLLPQPSSYARAGRLAQEAKALSRTWHLPSRREASDAPETAREWLVAAAAVADLPVSQRQFYRVLADDPH
jgi:hypothetical protein